MRRLFDTLEDVALHNARIHQQQRDRRGLGEAVEKVPAENKYRNVQTGCYASKREAKRAAELKLRERAGDIRNLREQVPFLLIPKQEGERSISYTADFCYEEAPDWKPITEDVKGLRTRDYIIRRKLMLFVHGIRIREV